MLAVAVARTRRNMLGVSTALILVYAFDWGFPADLRILNYPVPISALWFEVLAWGFLAYQIVEYLTHIEPEIRKFRSTQYVRRLMDQLSDYVIAQLSEAERDKIDEYQKINFPQHRFIHVHVDKEGSAGDELRISYKPKFMKDQIRESINTGGPSFKMKLSFRKIRYYRFRATLVALFREPFSFEYILPMGFPIIALGFMLYQNVPWPAVTSIF